MSASGKGQAPAQVFFAPMRSRMKRSMVSRMGGLLTRAGLGSAIAQGDLVAVKLHFGEQGNTGFVHPVFLREVVKRVRDAGGKPFLTDANTLYRGERSNAVDHLACAIHNGFSFATVDAPLIIADGLDGRDAVDVPVKGRHFDSVRIGSAAVYADAMVVVTHVKGHEATGFGGALKNVGMGLGCRSAKQRMHADFRPEVTPETCTACARCVRWCPVNAITIGPDAYAVVDRTVCYGCGECVAACPYGAIATQWTTDATSIQEKIVEHVAGALDGKDGKVVYVSFVTLVTPTATASSSPTRRWCPTSASSPPPTSWRSSRPRTTSSRKRPGSLAREERVLPREWTSSRRSPAWTARTRYSMRRRWGWVRASTNWCGSTRHHQQDADRSATWTTSTC